MKYYAACLLAMASYASEPTSDATGGALLDPAFEVVPSAWTLNVRNQTLDAEGNNILEITNSAQSPLSKGSQGLHIRVDEHSQIPPLVVQRLRMPIESAFRMKFSFRVNDVTTYSGGDGVLIIRMMTARGKEVQLVFAGNGSLRLGNQLANIPGRMFEQGIWYSVDAALPGPGSTDPATIIITPEHGSPKTIKIENGGGVEAGDRLNMIQIQPGFGARPITDVDIDDIQIEANQ